MTETFICDHCGGTRSIEKGEFFDGAHICHDCFMSETTICDHCEQRIWNRDNAATEYQPLCQDCYDAHYNTCADCGAILHHDNTCYTDDDSDVPYCESCVDSHRHDGIESYYYRPDPIFFGEGKRFLGVELEIDDGGERDSYARDIASVANQNNEHIYIKHDGSLDDGMEIVTHPMTLDYHQNQMPWEAVVEKCLSLGYTSHKAGTCGLHVHVSRNALGANHVEQENTIARILFFVENHWNELLRFSRRTQRQLNKWAARYGRKDSPKEVLDTAKYNSAGRYTCVNLTNSDTIEFRIFRGTLKYNTIIATLQLVDELCNVAIYLSDEEMQGVTWTDFVCHLDCEKYPELIQYLKERRLYVNEIIESEEDI